MSSFVMITLTLSFLFWYLSTQLDGTILNVDLAPLLVQIGNFMPSIVGLIFLIATHKKGNKKTKMNFSLKFFLFALLLMPLIVGVSYLIGSVFFQVEFDSLLLPIILENPSSLFIMILYFIVLQGPLGEEIGWRAFFLNELLKKNNLLKASIFVGLVWSFWHTPKFFMDNTIQNELFQSYGLVATLAGYTIYTMCLSIIISWLYCKTNRNIVFVLLFHAMANFSHGLVTILTQMSAVILIVIVLVLVTFLLYKTSIKKMIQQYNEA